LNKRNGNNRAECYGKGHLRKKAKQEEKMVVKQSASDPRQLTNTLVLGFSIFFVCVIVFAILRRFSKVFFMPKAFTYVCFIVFYSKNDSLELKNDDHKRLSHYGNYVNMYINTSIMIIVVKITYRILEMKILGNALVASTPLFI
jgi:uncharacterized membrane protein